MSETVLDCKGLRYDRDGFELFGGLSIKLNIGQIGLLLSEPQLRSRRLLQICATLKEPTRGRVTWFGGLTGNLSEAQRLELRRSLGYVHRESRLVSNMSIMDNIILGLLYHRNITPKEASARVRDLLHRFGVFQFRDWRPADVSFRVVRLAVYLRELVKNPRLFLLEFPSVDLDQDFEPMMEVIIEAVDRNEAALMLSEVRPDQTVTIADWVLLMNDNGNRFHPVDARNGLLPAEGQPAGEVDS